MLMTICTLIVSFSLKHNLFLEKQQTKDMWSCSGEKGNDRFGFSFVVTYQLLLKSDVQKLNDTNNIFIIDLIFKLFFC